MEKLKLCYIIVFLINILVILVEDVVAPIPILEILINQKLAIIPIIFIGILGNFFLFTSKCFDFTQNRKIIEYLLIISIFAVTLALILIGDTDALDNNNTNDDALEVWISSLFQGVYPYESRVLYNSPIAVFPFLPIYCIPFYFIYDVSLHLMVNPLILIFIFKDISKTRKSYLLALFGLLVSLPNLFFLLLQSDHITVITLALMAFSLLLKKKMIPSSILFGCLIATKGYVWMIIPLYLIHLLQTEGFRTAIKYGVITAITAAVLIVPFIIWNPYIFFNEAPLGINAGIQAEIFPSIPYSEYMVTLVIMVCSVLVYMKTKDIYLTFFITYLIWGGFLLLIPWELLFKFEIFHVVFLSLYFSMIVYTLNSEKKPIIVENNELKRV